CGHVAVHARRSRDGAGATGTSSASRPANSSASSASGLFVMSVPAHLGAQTVDNVSGENSDFGLVQMTRTGERHLVLLDDARGAARQHQNAVTEADGLAHVVRDEDRRQATLLPQAL